MVAHQQQAIVSEIQEESRGRGRGQCLVYILIRHQARCGKGQLSGRTFSPLIILVEVEGVAASCADLPRQFPGQLIHLPFGLLQQVQFHLAPRQTPGDPLVIEGVDVGQHPGDDGRQSVYLLLRDAPLGDPRGAHPDAPRVGGGGVAGDGVLVAHDAAQVQDTSCNLAHERITAGCVNGPEVHQQQVGIGAAVSQSEPLPLQCVGEVAGVVDDALLQRAELGRFGNLEGHRHGRELLNVGATLLAGEDGSLDALRLLRIGGQDHRPSRAADGLMGGEGDHIGDAHRGGVYAADDQPGGVSDVGHEERPHLIADGAEGLPVRGPGVRGVAGDDDAGAMLARQIADLVVVQSAGAGADLVGGHPVAPSGDIEGAAMGQVAAVGQGHAHDGVAQLEEGLIDRQVSRRAGEGLHIDVDLLGRDFLSGEALGNAPLRQALDEIGEFGSLIKAPVGVAAVVGEPLPVIQKLLLADFHHSTAGVPLSIDVLENGAQRLPHCQG